MNARRSVAMLCWFVLLWVLSLAGCGGGNDGATDHTTVGVEITSSPSNRAVEASLSWTETVKVNGTTPFSTEVRVPNECKGFEPNRFVQTGCGVLGHANFVPFVNDASNGTLKLCLSAFDERKC